MAYAPTNDADEQTKEDTKKKPQELVEQIHRYDIVIKTRDINAKVGMLDDGFERVTGIINK